MDLKQLKKLIQLCRQTGVESIKFEGIEMHLGPTPMIVRQTRQSTGTYTEEPITESAFNKTVAHYSMNQPQERIATDELTEEQLMLWSSGE